MDDKLLNALENERRYVARELHDGVAQTALQLGLQIGICRKMLDKGRTDMLTDELVQLEERIQTAARQIREMIADMRPPKFEDDLLLADASLTQTMAYLAGLHQERGGPQVEFVDNWGGEFPPALDDLGRLVLVRILSEALFNVRKHAEASKTWLRLEQDANNYYAVVADNGQGFDIEEVRARSVDKGGAGLANLYARAEAIGGVVVIARNKNSTGVSVVLKLPK